MKEGRSLPALETTGAWGRKMDRHRKRRSRFQRREAKGTEGQPPTRGKEVRKLSKKRREIRLSGVTDFHGSLLTLFSEDLPITPLELRLIRPQNKSRAKWLNRLSLYLSHLTHSSFCEIPFLTRNKISNQWLPSVEISPIA